MVPGNDLPEYTLKSIEGRTRALERMESKRDILIRGARRKDADSIASLSGQLGYPVAAEEMRRRIQSVSTRKNQKVFVAVSEGGVIGWLEVFIPLSVLNWGKAEIGALIVDESARGHGVGRKLLDAATRWARSHGGKFIYLRSNVKRRDAHKFYLKSGYAIFKTQHVFKLPLD